jgi:hypothetical protein
VDENQDPLALAVGVELDPVSLVTELAHFSTGGDLLHLSP